MTNKSILAGMLASMSLPLMAAVSPDVKGTIIDENGEPMSFVNVVLLSLPDSAFVQGATSNAEGLFNIETPAVQGILKVTSVGYETQYFDTRNFGPEGIRIQMRENNAMLDEVTVKAQLPKTKLTGNSMVTGIEGTVLEKSGTAKEMLAKVPGMTLKDDELEVLGKGQPVFYVNGRKVTDKDEFKRLRSEDIKEVEVITNPGAMYDATVTAVVKIKTVKRDGSGFGYDLSVSNNQDLQYGYSDPGATLNLRYRHKSVDLFGMVNYWSWNQVTRNDINQDSYMPSAEGITRLNQVANLRNDWAGEGMNYNLGFNWQIADNHSVGMRVERHARIKAETDYRQTSVITKSLWKNATRALADAEDNTSTQHTEADEIYNWEGNAYYVGSIGKLNVELNVDFRTDKTREENSIAENNVPGLMSSFTPEKNRMWADKLVLSYPIGKGQLQVGTEMSFVNRQTSAEMVGIALPSSKSEVQENNVTAFAQYSFQNPTVGSVSLGARYEHVGFDYKDLLDDEQSMTRYTDDLFPSASWSRGFGEWQTSVSYSFKTNRPNYWQLSDAYNYLNAYTLQQGNSKLKNEKIHEVSANVHWKVLNLYAAYERRDDCITQWSYIYQNATQLPGKEINEGIILLKHINMEKPVRNFAMFLSANPTFGCYSPNWSVGMQRFWTDIEMADPREATGKRVYSPKNPIGMADLNNAFRFKHSWQLELNANMMTAGDFTSFRFKDPTFNLRAVVQKCWLKNDALCLRASLSDILLTSSCNLTMDCGYYEIYQTQSRSNQRLDISLRYTFNAAKSKYKGTGAGQAAASRMSK